MAASLRDGWKGSIPQQADDGRTGVSDDWTLSGIASSNHVVSNLDTEFNVACCGAPGLGSYNVIMTGYLLI